MPLTLTRISAKANERTAGVNAYFRPEGDQPLILGKSVKVELDLPLQRDVFSAPLSALYGDDRVFTMEDGRLRAARIDRRGSYQGGDGERILFTSEALRNGESLVVTQLPNAATGIRVRVRKEETAGRSPDERVPEERSPAS